MGKLKAIMFTAGKRYTRGKRLRKRARATLEFPVKARDFRDLPLLFVHGKKGFCIGHESDRHMKQIDASHRHFSSMFGADALGFSKRIRPWNGCVSQNSLVQVG